MLTISFTLKITNICVLIELDTYMCHPMYLPFDIPKTNRPKCRMSRSYHFNLPIIPDYRRSIFNKIETWMNFSRNSVSFFRLWWISILETLHRFVWISVQFGYSFKAHNWNINSCIEMNLISDIPLKTEFSSILCNIVQNSMETIAERHLYQVFNIVIYTMRCNNVVQHSHMISRLSHSNRCSSHCNEKFQANIYAVF